MSNKENVLGVACGPTIGKCYREGKITRNPFLNFLRQYRKEHCGLSICQIAVEGAKRWHCMGCDDKRTFMELAAKAPKGKRRTRFGKRRLRHVKRQRLC